METSSPIEMEEKQRKIEINVERSNMYRERNLRSITLFPS